MKPSDLILQKALVASKLNTEEWGQVQAQLRDRAFFSATIEEERFLHTAREACARLADGSQSASEARRAMRRCIEQTGTMTTRLREINGEKVPVKEPLSTGRLNLILQHNTQSARNYARWKQTTGAGALAAFPAQELVRVRRVAQARNWQKRWKEAGGKVLGGRMVALKSDPIWTKLSRFGNPWPPFDFNSGMGVRNVSRKDYEALTGQKPPSIVEVQKKAQKLQLNDNMIAKVPMRTLKDLQVLQDKFGDQIQVNRSQIVWRGSLIRENFEKGNFQMKLGKASSSLLEKIPDDSVRAIYEDTGALTVSQSWLDSKRVDGSNHRVHFAPMKDYPTSKPLTTGDIELIPSIWRKPDRVDVSPNGSLVLTIQSPEGDYYHLVVAGRKETIDPKTGKHTIEARKFPIVRTFYRSEKETVEPPEFLKKK